MYDPKTCPYSSAFVRCNAKDVIDTYQGHKIIWDRVHGSDGGFIMIEGPKLKLEERSRMLSKSSDIAWARKKIDAAIAG